MGTELPKYHWIIRNQKNQELIALVRSEVFIMPGSMFHVLVPALRLPRHETLFRIPHMDNHNCASDSKWKGLSFTLEEWYTWLSLGLVPAFNAIPMKKDTDGFVIAWKIHLLKPEDAEF